MPTIMKSMNAISRCQALFRGDRAVSDELAPCHWSFVFAISRHEGLTQEELARALCLNKSTVARTLSHLEECGFVQRSSDSADKRVLRVYPTEKMKKVLPQIRRVTREWNELISAGISEEEMKVFASVLEKMLASARAAAGYGDDEG